MNPDVEMRPHQRAAVARAGQADEGTLVAHVVGAGKTYTGIAMCMEARRLGRANKPLVVVPKHLTEQGIGVCLPLSRVEGALYG